MNLYDTASVVYNEMLEMYFYIYYVFSDSERKEIDTK